MYSKNKYVLDYIECVHVFRNLEVECSRFGQTKGLGGHFSGIPNPETTFPKHPILIYPAQASAFATFS